jgi:hypothetical protein
VTNNNKPQLNVIQGGKNNIVEFKKPAIQLELVQALFPIHLARLIDIQIETILQTVVSNSADIDENGYTFQDSMRTSIHYSLPERSIPLSKEMVIDRFLACEKQLRNNVNPNLFKISLGINYTNPIYVHDKLDLKHLESQLVSKILDIITALYHESRLETHCKTIYGPIFRQIPKPVAIVLCPEFTRSYIQNWLNSKDTKVIFNNQFPAQFIYNEEPLLQGKIYVVFNMDPVQCPVSPLNFGNLLYREPHPKKKEAQRFRLINSFPVMGTLHLY